MKTIDPRNPECLHCWLSAATEAWATENARRDPASGKIIIDVDEVLTKVGDLIAEHIAGLRERPKRRAALKFAHDCVDAAYRYAVSGKQQAAADRHPCHRDRALGVDHEPTRPTRNDPETRNRLAGALR